MSVKACFQERRVQSSLLRNPKQGTVSDRNSFYKKRLAVSQLKLDTNQNERKDGCVHYRPLCGQNL